MADAKLTALTEVSVPAIDDLLYIVDVSDTTDDAAGSSRKVTISRLAGIIGYPAQGRLTTESGVSISTGNRTAQSTLYYTPYNGNQLAVYDGTRWRLYSFTEISIALSGLTTDKNYDVFVYDNAGTLTLELSAAWTNDTTRADALALQDGVYVKSGTTTRRYLGTIRTTNTTTTEDSATKRFVWNAYNRSIRPLFVEETTSSWTYSTTTWRQLNNSAANQVNVVAGLAVSPVRLFACGAASCTSITGAPSVSIGRDSTSDPADNLVGINCNLAVIDITAPSYRQMYEMVPLGYHYYAALEIAANAGTTTFRGQATELRRTGIVGDFEC